MMGTLSMVLALQTSALADVQDVYDQGLEALRTDQFETAEILFLESLDDGGHDPALYHALGNSLFRQEKYGAALVAWERGMHLDPRDGDLQANADHTRRELGLSLNRAGERSRLPWNQWLAPWEGALGAGFLLAMGFGALLIRRLRTPARGRRTGWETPILVTTGLLLAASTWEATRLDAGHIIIGDDVMARSAIGAQGVALFELSSGTATTVLEFSQEQVLIQLEDGRKGWLPASSVLSCDPEAPFSSY